MRFWIFVFVMASVSCAAARLRPNWNASAFPFTLKYCAGDLQSFTIDGDSVIRFAPTIGAEPKYAKVTATELAALGVLLRSADYGAAMRPFRVESHATTCWGTRFARVYHSNSAFDVPMGPGSESPASFLAVLRLVQDIRDSHFGNEFEPLWREAKP